MDKKKKVFTVLVGGAGMYNITAGLNKIGLEFSLATEPQRLMALASTGDYQAIVLADNIFLAECAGKKDLAEKRFLELLADLQKVKKAQGKKIWLITPRKKQEAWNIFARFEMVYRIVGSKSTVAFASGLKNWLEINRPAKAKQAKA